ncbi:MAG: hypothetical protein ACRC1T_18210 [Clostridium chrysemydis]|uniref:hypothetical protein n=1 Tax=Clostridium TaxID=1485 RepID=UPI002153A434|nr:hypothetical protein [Clostridium sp. LY3-2]MCR6513715.1 hypothetical protein [Clostridium sp. LY3-2]
MNKLLLKITCTTLFLFPFLPYIKEFNFYLGNAIEFLLLSFLIIMNICTSFNTINKVVFKQMIIILFFILFLILNIKSNNLSDGLSALRIYIEPFIIGLSFTNIYSKFGKLGVLKVISSIILSVVIMCILGIIQFIFPDIILKIRPSGMYNILRPKSDFVSLSIYNRVMSLMNDPNVYSVFLVVVYPVIDLFQYRENKNSKKIIVYKVLIISNIVLTNSRQGMILILFYILLSKVCEKIISKNSDITLSIKNISKYILGTVILIVSMLNIDKFINSILKMFRIDTLHNLNGREEKNEFVKRMLFHNSWTHTFFGGGLNTGRDFIFENSFNLIISQVGIIGIFVMIIAYFLFYITFIPINKNLIKKEYVYILTFLILMYSGDYILIPQVSIYFFVVVFSFAIFQKREIEIKNMESAI